MKKAEMALLTKENFLLWQEKDLSTRDIIQLTGLSVNTILKKRRSFGIEKFRPSYETRKEVREEIVNLYSKGFSSKEIKEKLGVGFTKIFKALKKENIKSRLPNDASYLTHNTKQDFFETIDSEDKAYILGFIYADGYISRKDNRLQIGLAIKDLNLLEAIRDKISPSSKIFFDEKTKSCRLLVNGKKLREDLEAVGAHQNKTLTLKFPTYEIVPQEFFHHFIRGYFDGDGGVCLSFSKDGYPNIKYSFCGNKEFILMLDSFLKSKVIGNRTFTQKQNCKTCFEITCGSGFGFREMYRYLYHEASIFLNRKKEKFEKCMGLRSVQFDEYLQKGV